MACNEQWLELSDDTRSDKDEIEDGEESELKISDGDLESPSIQKENPLKRVEKMWRGKLVIDVIRVAIQSDVHVVVNEFSLLPEWHSELKPIALGSYFGVVSSRNHIIVEFFNGSLMSWRFEPNSVPVSAPGE